MTTHWSLYFLPLLAICYFAGNEYVADRFGKKHAYYFAATLILIFLTIIGYWGYLFGRSLG